MTPGSDRPYSNFSLSITPYRDLSTTTLRMWCSWNTHRVQRSQPTTTLGMRCSRNTTYGGLCHRPQNVVLLEHHRQWSQPPDSEGGVPGTPRTETLTTPISECGVPGTPDTEASNPKSRDETEAPEPVVLLPNCHGSAHNIAAHYGEKDGVAGKIRPSRKIHVRDELGADAPDSCRITLRSPVLFLEQPLFFAALAPRIIFFYPNPIPNSRACSEPLLAPPNPMRNDCRLTLTPNSVSPSNPQR